jgi:LysR family glycine cleavage system transcriptional activator
MNKALPPLSALRAFEATARHLSFTRAADELHVTPAALSHQIKGLEEFLGVRLFVRRTRAIELTDAGRLLYPGLHAAFLQIRQAVGSLERLRNDRVLVISAPPGFTAKWLAPRLYRFMMAEPDIDARVSSTFALVDFAGEGVDVAIRNAADHADRDPDLLYEPLLPLVVQPVMSPRLLEQIGPLDTPEDLRRVNLIHDDSLRGRNRIPTWEDWFRAAGVAGVDVSRGLRFSSADHAIDATVEGAGVLLSYSLLAHDDLRTGRLIAPFPIALATRRSFYLVCPKGTEQRPKVAAFRSWLAAEVARLDPALASPPAVASLE